MELIKPVREFLFADGQDRIILSDTTEDALDGFRTTATKHGGFYEDMSTIKSPVHLVGQ